MRKCEKCGASMKLDLRLKVNGGGYGMVVRVDEKQKATTIDDVRVAVCPECGYTEMYLEDLTNLKENYAEIRKFISDFFGKLKIMCNFAQCKI